MIQEVILIVVLKKTNSNKSDSSKFSNGCPDL